MAATVTAILAQIRKQADMPGGASTGFRTDADILAAMQYEWNELYDLLVKKCEGLFVTHTSGASDITVASGTKEYALPTVTPAIKKLVGVDLLLASPDYVSLGRIAWEERNTDQAYLYELMTGTPTGYMLLGDKILLFPSPNSSGTVRLWYVPQASVLKESGPGTGEIIAMPTYVEPGWETVIIDGVTARLWLAQQDMEMASLFEQKKEKKKVEILEALQGRDGNRPAAVQLIRRRRRL